MTIVPAEKIQTNVSTLAYHYPSMSVVRYNKKASEYYFWKSVELLEQAAKQNGKVIVPGTCFHWMRKKKLKDRQLTVFKSTFYQLGLDELTAAERGKYLAALAGSATEEDGHAINA